MVSDQAAPVATGAIGVTAGHWTDGTAVTGCTVVLFDRPAPTVVDVRGGAPGTRETDLLAPGRLVRHVDGLLLTGGSAFGLAAADGVMRHLAGHGRGFVTAAGPVPIVPAAVIYDLAVGRPIAPDSAAGLAACRIAGPIEELSRGRIGVGTGATTGKLFGGVGERGGFGIGSFSWPSGSVTALVAVNAVGEVVDPSTGVPLLAPDRPRDRRAEVVERGSFARVGESTTLAVVLVSTPVDETALARCAVAAHDAFARAIRPSHTIFDGDLVFASGRLSGSPTAVETMIIATATELAVERAIVDAVTA